MCFDEGKRYPKSGFTYPLPCKSQPKQKQPSATIVAQKKLEPKSINHPSFQSVGFDELDEMFKQAAADLRKSSDK